MQHRAGETVHEVLARAVVAPQGALVEHLDGLDASAGDGGLQTRANDLDLGKLWHYSEACRPVHASRAAAISACFLLDPSPVAIALPSISTVAAKRLRWSGPLSVTA